MFTENLNYYIRASYPLLTIETAEETRCLEDIRRTCQGLKDANGNPTSMLVWDEASGMHDYTLESRADGEDNQEQPFEDRPYVLFDADPKSSTLPAAIEKANNKFKAVLVLRDVMPGTRAGGDSVGMRRLKSFLAVASSKMITVIVMAPKINLPVMLEKQAQFMTYSLPTHAELRKLLEHGVELLGTHIKKKNQDTGNTEDTPDPSEEEIENAVSQLQGMTEAEASNAIYFMAMKSLDGLRERGESSRAVFSRPEFRTGLFEEKVGSLKDSALQYYPTGEGFESVGGLQVIKDWAAKRRLGFTQSARDLRLPYPKGCLITGIKGTGKTRIAHAIAHQMGFPLFRLDLGNLFGSLVGETEANTRRLIGLLESIGSAVVFVDEIEKYLNAGATSGQGDSGASSRMFGQLLSWLSDKTVPVFMIGTCNNIDAMPPELTRKGRYDEIFFVDLPSEVERAQIFEVILKHKFGREMEFDSEDPLIKTKSDRFSGAEIEAAIQETFYEVLAGNLEDSPDQLRGEMQRRLKNMTPHADIHKESVKKLRDTAKDHYVLANGESKSETVMRQLGI